MIKSYFTTALRHLFKNRSYTTLNIIGLSIGLSCFTLIGLWVKHELGYDRFHEKADRIYRIGGTFTDESGKFDQAVTPPPLAAAVVNDFPEVEASLRFDQNGDATVKHGADQLIETDILVADSSFFNIFSFKLVSGDPATALNDPYSLILSESMAKKYFGDSNPIGESLTIFLYDPDGKGSEYKITGVIEDCPTNSQFHYNFLVSFKTHDINNPNALSGFGWYWNGYYTYLLLKEGADPKALEAKFPQMIDKYMGKTNKEWKVSYDYFLQPLASIHLGSHLRYEIRATSSMSYVIIFGTIGVIVLLLACINYINLSTAFSADRFREVGMRKVMGAVKNQLIGQYLTEAWILSIASALLAFLLIELCRPLFESLTGVPVVGLYALTTLVSITLIASLVGILSGFYPSLLLSSFRPVNILKGGSKLGSSGVWLRKGLVIVQYSITIVLVIGILVVNSQMRFIEGRDLGFNKDQLLLLKVNGSQEVKEGWAGFANELRSSSLISAVARSNSMIAGGLGNSVGVMEDVTGKKVNATIYSLRTDFDYVDTYGMKLVAGRNFASDNRADSTRAYIVNESTAKTYGYTDPADIIGKPFEFSGNAGEVIGVVKDFNYNSLQFKVEPTVMSLLKFHFSRVAVRLNGNTREGMDFVTALWKKHFPNSVVDFQFAEDALTDQYQSEQRFSKVFIVFSAISLAIACLGLFALVSYSVETRTKEIGIRKALGATVGSILAMLSKEFLLLVAVAAAVAIPVGYYFMRQWLLDFAYRVELNPIIFVLAGLLVLVVAWVTVSLRSVRAAVANPVDSLRNE